MVEHESNRLTSVSTAWLEAPVEEPDAVQALATPLISLVHFQEALATDMTLEQAHHALGEWRVAFMPVVGGRRVLIGLRGDMQRSSECLRSTSSGASARCK